ncbi:MAG TPA: hypothetical protein VNA25_00615, partial [Phycisphaerae bacterium]|nr:hypothetical protein [Phycisphaerae bacterium]
ANVLFRELAQPPYGVTDGLHPVLLCASMVARSDEGAICREGTFTPEPGIADWEALLRRPELFAVAGRMEAPHPFPITWKE